MEHVFILVLSALKLLTVLLGAAFLWVTVRAYRKHRTRGLAVLIFAVALMTTASVAEGAAFQTFGLSLDQAHVIEGVFMLAAFAVLLWSVVVPHRRRVVVEEAPSRAADDPSAPDATRRTPAGPGKS